MSSALGETPLFDPVAIETLRTVAGDGAPGFVAEMAQLFLEETTKSLGQLKDAGLRGDWKQVTRVAHSLKSSAATLGLMRLSAACSALELDTRGGASPQTQALITAVFDQFEAAGPALTSLS